MSKVLLLPPNVAKIASVAAKDQHGRYGATTGIQVSRRDGKYRIEATNGRVAAIITGTPDQAEDYPTGPFLQAAPNGAASAVVPAGIWSKGFRDLPKRTAAKPILANLAVVLGKERITLSSTDLETDRAVQPRVVEGRFPEIDRIIPKGKPKATACVSIAELRSLLSVAEAVGSGVTFEFHDKNGPLVLRARHEDSDQEFLGLAAPIVPNDSAGQQPNKPDAKPSNGEACGVVGATPQGEPPADATVESEPAPAEKPKRRRASKALAAAASILAAIGWLGRWLSMS
jgi:hypothetical protein